MPYLPLEIPPGMSKPGTVYDARGRWFDGNLVRWYEGSLQPIGGWSIMEAPVSGVDVDVGGPVRGMWAWKDSSREPCLAFGTPDGIWLYRGGVLTDITDNSYTAGAADADIVSGQYGSGPYGAGAFGLGVEAGGVLVEATTWQLDNYGQQLIACAQSDGRILLKSDPSTSNAVDVLSNAPTGCVGVVVTPERFIVALGAGGDDRKIQWSDQEGPTTWTPADDNQAGDFILTTPGNIMAGRRGANETLIWTDVDLWRMRYIGGDFVYSVTRVADNCGAISRHSMSLESGRAYWMGSRQFFVYDGHVRPIPCEVANYVFGSINRLQRSKVCAYTRAQYGEVTWHYPSQGSNENDRYVTYNYLTDRWYTGELERTSGVDVGAFGFPIAADAQGQVYQHEIRGGEYADPDGNAITPFIESGPIELGRGDQVMMARQIIPDQAAQGSVKAKIYTSFYPVESETLSNEYTLGAAPVDVRLTARAMRLRLEAVDADWKVGTFRLEVVAGGGR